MKSLPISETKLRWIYKTYPDHEHCIQHLEKIIWKGGPKCPYCSSSNGSTLKSENRHHCNNCNTSYCVTVGSVYHNTKIDLQKWFYVEKLMIDGERVSLRQLSDMIGVSKNTAMRMVNKIKAIKNQSIWT